MILRIATIFFVYILFWAVSAFLVLPFGIRTYHDVGHDEDKPELVPGQAESAPTNYRPWRFVLRTTIVATLLCALFFANYYAGWVTIDDISLIHPPASMEAGR